MLAGITNYDSAQSSVYSQVFVTATARAMANGVNAKYITVNKVLSAVVNTSSPAPPSSFRRRMFDYLSLSNAATTLTVSYTVNIPDSLALGFSDPSTVYNTISASPNTAVVNTKYTGYIQAAAATTSGASALTTSTAT